MSITDSINNIRSTGTEDINVVVDRWKSYKSPKDAATIYNALKPAVSGAIQSYGGGDRSLTAQAYRIAYDSLNSYDKTKGTDVKTHVHNHLKRLNRISADRNNIVHIPEGVAKDYSTVAKAIANFVDEFDREPNEDELSDITKLSKKRIDKILNRTTSISGSEAFTEEGGDRVTHSGISDDSYIDYLYASSDNIDKKIIEMTAGRRGSRIYQNAEVARRLRMTPAAVSQRMNKLRDRMVELKRML
jgi:DNA-directed RNA polymerase specialized sigma subunit